MAEEEHETVQFVLPKPMANWFKARAVRHDRPLSAEGRSPMYFCGHQWRYVYLRISWPG
jgi:hypothetical protein